MSSRSMRRTIERLCAEGALIDWMYTARGQDQTVCVYTEDGTVRVMGMGAAEMLARRLVAEREEREWWCFA